jgi:hypothetical protein
LREKSVGKCFISPLYSRIIAEFGDNENWHC